MNNAEDAVGANELPRINGLAALAWVADESHRIDGSDGAVGQRSAVGAAIHHGLVDVDPFFILSCGTRGRRIGSARACRQAVAGGFRGGVEVSRISDVVVYAGQGRASAGDDRGEAGERVRGF